MSFERYAPPPVEDWLARSLRLVVFPTESQLGNRTEWWSDLVGKDPDHFNRSKMAISHSGILDAEANMFLSLSIDPHRMLWELEPGPVEQDKLERIPTLGKLREQMDKFINFMQPWLSSCPQVKRIGVAAPSIFRVPTHRDGYVLLDRLLKTVVVNPDTTDFQYRINRKTQSGIVSGLVLNNLGTWVAHRTVLKTSVPDIDRNEQQTVFEDCFVLAEIDINTHQHHDQVFSTGQLSDLLKELSSRAIDKVTQGDTND